MRFTGCSLEDAIRMASTNPARLMGFDHLGEIREGKRADLILFTLEDGNMQIQKTWGGRESGLLKGLSGITWRKRTFTKGS
jgi:N-acetylglucosamine-6-phosphate deacetylase